MNLKSLRYATFVTLTYTLLGALWCIKAVLEYFDLINTFAHAIFTVFLILFLLFTLLWRFERSDEMAVANLNRAKAVTLDICVILSALISCGIILYSALSRLFFPDIIVRDTPLTCMIALIIGLPRLITGLLFKRYERE